MKYTKTIFLLVFALSWPSPAKAGSAGAEPFNFLFLDANARAVALSGAYTALAADANALQYNPAGLGRITRHQTTFMHNQYFQDITQEYLAYASPKGWGAAINYLDYGDTKNTTISNHTGAGLGNISAVDMAVSAGYGYALSEDLSVGAGIKFIKETIDHISGQGFALDMGVSYAVPMVQGLSFGAAVQNIGPAVKFQSDKENMPLTTRIGAAYAFKALGQASVLSADLAKERSEDVLAGFGLETIVAKCLPLRLGYNTRNNDGPGITAGLGYLFGNLNFDYAFAPFKELGATHRFSVTLLWGQEKPRMP
jgi:hypothetical protein